MRGASYLAGIDLKSKDGPGKSMIVVDIGGTTTDVGVLLPSGFPRQAAAFIEGGYFMFGIENCIADLLFSCWCSDEVSKLVFVAYSHSDFSFDSFTMPDVHSIGLGGGSRVRIAENGRVSVGPDSVGHHVCPLICSPTTIQVFDLRICRSPETASLLGVVNLRQQISRSVPRHCHRKKRLETRPKLGSLMMKLWKRRAKRSSGCSRLVFTSFFSYPHLTNYTNCIGCCG